MKKYLALLFLLVCTITGNAQDMHFSQYYASPLTLNSATTGLFTGDYRVGLNYRTQWGSVTIPYVTMSAFTDFSFLKGVFDKDWMGAGFVIVNDKAGDGNFTTMKMIGSLAYHYSLNFSRTHIISAGVSGGLIQKRVDYSLLTFDNQWNGTTFDRLGISNGESVSMGSLNYFDLEASLEWSYEFNSMLRVFAGTSLAHVIQPNESYYDDDNSLGIRPVLNAGGRIWLTDDLVLLPNVMFMKQKSANEYLLGSAISYALTKTVPSDINIFTGAWYRSSDAVILLAGMEIKNIVAGVSYDVNISKLNNASRGRGALEISLIYIGKFPNLLMMDKSIPCPRF